MVTQILHAFVVLFTGLSRSGALRVMKVMELAGFIGIEIILFVCSNQSDTLTSQSYNTLGAVAVAILFLIIIVSGIRSIYTGLLLKKEYSYKEKADKRHTRQAEVIRRDEWYGSD